jgi:hypothetical protein
VAASSWAEAVISSAAALVSSVAADTSCVEAEDCSDTVATSFAGGGDVVDPLGHVGHGGADLLERLPGLVDHDRAVLGLAGAVGDDRDRAVGLALDLADEGGPPRGRPGRDAAEAGRGRLDRADRLCGGYAVRPQVLRPVVDRPQLDDGSHAEHQHEADDHAEGPKQFRAYRDAC